MCQVAVSAAEVEAGGVTVEAGGDEVEPVAGAAACRRAAAAA